MVDFELIKGRIKQHRLSSIIYKSFELLNEVQRRNDKSFPIWNVLALIKWTYLCTTDSILRKPIQPHEFDQLLTLIRNFEVKYTGINFKSPNEIDRSFKIIAYQQFALQDKFHYSILSRQVILYLKSSSNFDIDSEFEQLTHIKLKAFLEYIYFTFFFFHFDELGKFDIKYEGELFASFFDIFNAKWGEQELNKYLNLISIKDSKDFKDLHKLNKEILQLYETDFFTTNPLILFRGFYRIPHRAIFVQTIKHFVYDYLKDKSPGFTTEFGKRAERYIELGLMENKIKYLNETTLKQICQSGMVADYLIQDEVLVEVKAIELNPLSGVLRDADILLNDLDNTIIKAYKQLLSTANKIDRKKEYHGIIVTYKEMYLGFGTNAWEEFLKVPIEKFCFENNINISMLPRQNLFFINIENWDHMMQIIKDEKIPLKQILLKGKELNAHENIAEKVFMMEQVLNNHFSIKQFTLKYLTDAHSELDIIPERHNKNL